MLDLSTSLTFVVNNSKSLPNRRLELFGRDERYVAVAVLQQSDEIVLGQFARVIILNHQSIIAHYGFVSSTSARNSFLEKLKIFLLQAKSTRESICVTELLSASCTINGKEFFS
jgi:hypothetical protein